MAFVEGFRTLPIKAISSTTTIEHIAAVNSSENVTNDSHDAISLQLTTSSPDLPNDDGRPLQLAERFGATADLQADDNDVSASPVDDEIKVIKLNNNEWWFTERFKSCEDCRMFMKQYTASEMKDMARECNIKTASKKSDLATALWAYAAVVVAG